VLDDFDSANAPLTATEQRYFIENVLPFVLLFPPRQTVAMLTYFTLVPLETTMVLNLFTLFFKKHKTLA
jgi:hypothetical protein